jgi:hypothetical protein
MYERNKIIIKKYIKSIGSISATTTTEKNIKIQELFSEKVTCCSYQLFFNSSATSKIIFDCLTNNLVS